jgi:hypothetical protein
MSGQGLGSKYQYYLKGTKAYEKKVLEFRISPDEARAILFEYCLKKEGIDYSKKKFYPGTHVLVSDSSYVYSVPAPDKVSIPLSGYYIHGSTGVVSYIKRQSKISWSYFRNQQNP